VIGAEEPHRTFTDAHRLGEPVGGLSAEPDEILETYPGSPYEVRPPDPAGRTELPAGHGALAVDAWRTPGEAKDSLDGQAPIIGIDGKPAASGFGRALVVVPAGERLVEVQVGKPRQTTPLTVAEGQVVEFEFSPGSREAHRGPQRHDGLLGLFRSRPRSRIAPWFYLAMAIAAVLYMMFMIGITWYGGVLAVGAFCAVPGLWLLWVGWSGWKRGRRPAKGKQRKGKR
jgi:hypothetical protein